MSKQEVEEQADPRRIENLMKKKSFIQESLEYFYEKIKSETGKTPSLEEINKEHKKAKDERRRKRLPRRSNLQSK